jgi:outer membrane biosynthesis protein TonB
VDELDNNDEQALEAKLVNAREGLDGLLREIHEIDGELEGLSIQGQQYQLLHELCGGLEKLQEQGAEELFWDGLAVEGRGEAHLGLVRSRVDDFQRRISAIESSRLALVEKLDSKQEVAHYFEEELFEKQRLEEERKQEWVVERELDSLPTRMSVMPWTHGREDDIRLRKSMAGTLLASLLLALLLPLIDLPIRDPWEPVEVPERLTRLIKEERLPPPPPPMEVETTPTEPETVEEQVVAEESTPKPSPKQAPDAAPKKATATKGILAFREKFSGMGAKKPAALLGAKARINRSGEAASGRPQRSLVTTQAPGSSGGINLASLSRDIGGGGGQQIEGVEVGQATSSIGAISGPERPLSAGPGPARTDEEIQIVFDRHKAALYRLYNRELRRDPTLQGQMVLRISIEPDGSVSLCEIQSTDMKAPKLGTQVVGRVKTFDFGAKEGVPAITILYPIDFLPAT